jgi:predicted nucleic acid-binding protein
LPETNWLLLGRPFSIGTIRQAKAYQYRVGQHVPNPRTFKGGLIAATAMVHSMTVVTRNLADFEATGVAMLNPWTTSSTLGKV